MTGIIDAIIGREGGYVDHPADRGGPTNWGITLQTLSMHRGIPVSPADVKALSMAEAREIYVDHYVVAPGFHRVADEGVREHVVDCAVLHGPETAARWLQRAVCPRHVSAGLFVDGVVGPLTRAAVAATDPATIHRRLAAIRIRHMGAIVRRDRSQAAFVAGWLNRAADLLLTGVGP